MDLSSSEYTARRSRLGLLLDHLSVIEDSREPHRVVNVPPRLVGDRQRQAPVGKLVGGSVHPVALPRRPRPVPPRAIDAPAAEHVIPGNLVNGDPHSRARTLCFGGHGNDLLAGITPFFEIDSSNRLKINHLRNKLLLRC